MTNPDRLAEMHRLLDDLAREILDWDYGTIQIHWSPDGPKASITKYINRKQREERVSA